jgi:two-component system, OmpR family, KDP operon response regulator KdpE
VRVLAVDDEPQILRALRTSLAARGHEVATAPNGETALDTLAGHEVDLVVLDLGLPGIDGVEVIRRLRSWSEVPVIVLSVRDAQLDKVAALDAGADDYVTKPFARHLVSRAGTPIHLTPTEFALLEIMVTNPGKLLTHRLLLQKVWGQGYQDESHYLRVYVAGLRKKLEPDPAAPSLILTEPGVGYRWTPDPN